MCTCYKWCSIKYERVSRDCGLCGIIGDKRDYIERKVPKYRYHNKKKEETLTEKIKRSPVERNINTQKLN